MTPASRHAPLYLVLTCLLWALVPSLTFPNPPLDVMEGFAWGRELALGYTKHPPLPSWALEAVFRLTGGHVFGAYWLSALCLGLGYLCLWPLGRRLGLTREQVAWGLLLSSVTFYFTLPLPEFNHNIAQIPVWAGMMLVSHKALESGRLRHWLLLGLIAALGLYTKYFVALLIGSIGLYCLVFADARRHLRTPGPYLAAAVCIALLVPHLLWLVETDGLTLRYAASRSHGASTWLGHVINPLNFLLAQIGNHAGLFLVLLAGSSAALWARLRGQRTAAAAPLAASAPSTAAVDRRFLLWFALLPLGVVLLASAVTGNEFEHMWGTPLFLLSGFVAVVLVHLPRPEFRQSRALAAVLLLQGVFLAITLGQALLEPQWKTKHTRIHYPGREVALALSETWRVATGQPIAYVAGDMWSAAPVTVFAPERPHMLYEHDLDASPWIDPQDLQDKGVLLVWRGSETPPPGLIALYPGLKPDSSRSFPFHGGGSIPPVSVFWAIIPPGAVNLGH
ncbi:glycosyltransferase family 39 protein [Roseibium aestuarii]|uniref:Glycosyltransferase family 39 protein n=1 Tax=Roseibium aestuarii TaxID=2600299 RepID=A0ABW4JYW9_9HYPH|nr:glycosyltransferase family 39 protein [Roseibium aestuarii]